jgi:hypothetical protein
MVRPAPFAQFVSEFMVKIALAEANELWRK